MNFICTIPGLVASYCLIYWNVCVDCSRASIEWFEKRRELLMTCLVIMLGISEIADVRDQQPKLLRLDCWLDHLQATEAGRVLDTKQRFLF